jgi:nucleoside-diphosphate-sugar epimerase
MTDQQLKIAVAGAGGKMGMRVSNNLQRSTHDVRYVENSPAGQRRTIDAGRTLTDAAPPSATPTWSFSPSPTSPSVPFRSSWSHSSNLAPWC